MKSPKITRFKFDPLNPPPLTREQEERMRALAEMPDETIDFSDIPPATEEFWRKAERNPFYRPLKKQLTLRLDADILAWFKTQARSGKGYQTDINRALREYVRAHTKKAG